MIIHECEQGSPEWLALRAGMPTASDFKKLITSKGAPSKSINGYAITLAAEKYAGKPVDAWEGNQWSERGKVLEAEAREWYEMQYDCEAVQVGFITDDAKAAGCSPDSLIGEDGMLEIKCLKAERHIEAALYIERNGKCPPDYIQQTQGQMLLAEREYCDLLFYHPELPSVVIRQIPDKDIRAGLVEQLNEVCRLRDSILAELRWKV